VDRTEAEGSSGPRRGDDPDGHGTAIGHPLVPAHCPCEGRYATQSRNLCPRVPSPEGEGQEEGMGKAGALVRSPIEDCRCYARRRPGRSRRLSLPLVLPPLRERLGPARSAAGRGKMPSTGEAIRHPEQRPLPLRPFSRGRRTGRGEGRCVGSESCRGLRGAASVMDRGVRAGCPSLLVSLLRGRDAARHVLPRSEPRCHRREERYVNQGRDLCPCVPSPEGEGQEEGMGTTCALVWRHAGD
jgi:hypothetical protein